MSAVIGNIDELRLKMFSDSTVFFFVAFKVTSAQFDL